MRLSSVINQCKVVGRAGYSLDDTDKLVAFLNLAYRKIAREAKPFSLITNTCDTSASPLLFVSNCEFVKIPKEITKEDIENVDYEIELDDMLFDCFVFCILTSINPSEEALLAEYEKQKNLYREEIFNARLQSNRF